MWAEDTNIQITEEGKSKYKKHSVIIRNKLQEFPSWHREMNLTRNHEFAVRSLASVSGLRNWCCCKLWCKSQMQLRAGVAVALAQAGSNSSDQTSGLGTSIFFRGCSPKKANDKKKKKKNYKRSPLMRKASLITLAFRKFNVSYIIIGIEIERTLFLGIVQMIQEPSKMELLKLGDNFFLRNSSLSLNKESSLLEISVIQH